MKVKLNHISLEVTSFCMLNCKYCYNTWKIPGTSNFTPFNSYKLSKKTLKQLFMIADIKSVTFTGGEPFLAERFKELVLYARMKKKSVTIITNGNAGSEEDYKQMIELGVNLFELPVLSDDPIIHDYLTEIKGSWESSVNSLNYLSKSGAKVAVVIVITKANYKQIGKTLEFISRLGIKNVMLNRFNIGGQGIKEKDNLLMTHEELNFAFKEASIAGKAFKLLLTSNVCTPLCVVDPKDYTNIRFSTCSPDINKRPLTIDIFGDLRFCNHSPAILGNIFTDDLNTMLNSEKAGLWNKIVPDYCTDCNLFAKCMAGCRAASEQLKLSLNSPDPILLSK